MFAAHQQVVAPALKEHHFFDKDEFYAQGFRHYLRGFPRMPWSSGRLVTFEATPNYLFHEKAAARIHKHLPDVKLIVVLRDPVQRAYSAWNMYRQFQHHPLYAHLHDPRSFEQAVDDELNGRTTVGAHLYLARGQYATLLRRYFDLFGRDRVLVVRYDRLDRDPAAVMAECCAFLGLEPYAGEPAKLKVRDNVRPYKGGLPPELRNRMEVYFAPAMAELERLLGPGWDLLKAAT